MLAPLDAFRHRRAGYASAPSAERKVIASELALAALVAIGLAFEPFTGARIYLCSAILMQISMGVWAAWLPHRAPAWLLWIARHLTVLPSLAVKSLVHHDLHHERPDVPSAWLGA